jgi:hypothetical protein
MTSWKPRCSIQNNDITKRLSWKGQARVVKNLIEVKSARRVRILDNRLSNCWRDGQTGGALNVKIANQNGTHTAAIAEDISIERNEIKNVAYGMNISGTDYANPSGDMARVGIRDNLFVLRPAEAGEADRFININAGAVDVVVDHNTLIFLGTGNAMIYGARGSKMLPDRTVVPARDMVGFQFTNNLVMNGVYGFGASGGGFHGAPLSMSPALFPGAVFAGNVIGGAPSTHKYPAGNVFPTLADFLAALAPDTYRLLSTATYEGVTTDGTPVGRR